MKSHVNADSTWETIALVCEGELRLQALKDSFAQSVAEFWASPAAHDLLHSVFGFDMEQPDIATWEGEGGR